MRHGGYILCFCTVRQGMDCSLRKRRGAWSGLACAYRWVPRARASEGEGGQDASTQEHARWMTTNCVCSRARC